MKPLDAKLLGPNVVAAIERLAKWGDGWQSEERGSNGRFGSGGGSSSSGNSGGARVEAAHGSSFTTPTGPRPGMGDITVTPKMIADLSKGPGSATPFIRPDGTFTPERQALHDQIVSEALRGGGPVDNPRLTLLGGGPGSGKSTALAEGGVPLPENAVKINADDIKDQLPEIQKMQNSDPVDKTWASFGHEESSYLAARIQAAAYEKTPT